MVRDIAMEVKRLIREHLGVGEQSLSPQASLIADLGADSLSLMELTLTFEEAFDIDIADEDAEKLHTVQEAIDCVEKHLATRPSA